MEITKVKIKKQCLLVSYKTQKKLDNGEISYIKRTDEDDAEPHKDLLSSLKALQPHLVRLADQKKDNSVEVTGVSLKGEGDDLKVVITGTKLTENGVIALNTPNTKVYGEDDGLDEAIENVIKETKLYLEGKAEESNQLSLFEKEEEEEEEEEY